MTEVFSNDYWGRPMNSPSSHKSWRPLTVLTFRWGKGFGGGWFGWHELFVHRLVNVLIHSLIAELAGIAAVLLYPDLSPLSSALLSSLAKLIFALHPTHVEAVANGANRPHILAVLCSAVMLDPRNGILVVALAGISGLGCSETFLFQLPAVLVTTTVVRWKRSNKERNLSTLGATMASLLPRYALTVLLAASYLLGRHYFDTLSIPDGLIRPAENPFYDMAGARRARNYLYVLSVHVLKALCLDPIGFSHEYGRECVREIDDWFDLRMALPASIAVATILVGVRSVASYRRTGDLEAFTTWIVAMSWLATLFPVSGIVKVGTFIADRIVVASTFAFSIFLGRFLTYWIVDDYGCDSSDLAPPTPPAKRVDEREGTKRERRGSRRRRRDPVEVLTKIAIVLMGSHSLWKKVQLRTEEWTSNVMLLESSLKSCPRSAKSNLEISKIYSGMYPELLDLDKARSHLTMAESVDPNYCDVHQQFAHVAIQRGKFLEFEDRLTKAVTCPFTMAGSAELYRRYWKQLTSDPNTRDDAMERMRRHQRVIDEAVARAVREEEEKARRENDDGGGSPLREEF